MRKRAFLIPFLFVACARAAELYSVVPAYPSLRFEQPLYAVAPPDGSNRIFVVEQDGRVLWFDHAADHPKVTIAIDIRDKVRRMGMEEGLLGLAFHPDFKSNGVVFLHYSASD